MSHDAGMPQIPHSPARTGGARRAVAPTGAVEAIHAAMRQVVALRASDLHIKAGAAPSLRLNGELTAIPGTYAISEEEMEAIVRELTRSVPARWEEFQKTGETDVSYELPGAARFRVSVFRQRGSLAAVLRVIPDEVVALPSLNLPPVIEQLAQVPRGLVLVTGATGSGKSTTLAAIIDHINATSARHIVTVEDPIEVVHRDKRSIVNQREVGLDTQGFAPALRRALRQDPDVIMIGEIRDEETMRVALSAAETGHLVLSTLHTIDVMESIYRVLDFFPPALERQARSMLAGSLQGIVSQRLVRTATGNARIPAVEVLVGTSRVTNAIKKADETEKLHDAVAEGRYYGMQTFDQALLQHVVDGHVTVEEAMYHATSKQNFALMLEANSVSIDREVRRRAAGLSDDVSGERHVDEQWSFRMPPPAPGTAPPPFGAPGGHQQLPPPPPGYGQPGAA